MVCEAEGSAVRSEAPEVFHSVASPRVAEGRGSEVVVARWWCARNNGDIDGAIRGGWQAADSLWSEAGAAPERQVGFMQGRHAQRHQHGSIGITTTVTSHQRRSVSRRSVTATVVSQSQSQSTSRRRVTVEVHSVSQPVSGQHSVTQCHSAKCHSVNSQAPSSCRSSHPVPQCQVTQCHRSPKCAVSKRRQRSDAVS